MSAPLGTTPTMNHFAIMVPDMDEGVRWYTETLGFGLTDRWANDETAMEWAHLSLGDFCLELVKRPGLEPATAGRHGYHHVALTVDDCDAVVEALRGRGVEIMSPPQNFDRHEIRWAFVRDYLGNILEIISPLSGRRG
jgi:catechol 2,3-dioxygenase-like lactoylglutathione lyase family enzyme